MPNHCTLALLFEIWLIGITQGSVIEVSTRSPNEYLTVSHKEHLKHLPLESHAAVSFPEFLSNNLEQDDLWEPIIDDNDENKILLLRVSPNTLDDETDSWSLYRQQFQDSGRTKSSNDPQKRQFVSWGGKRDIEDKDLQKRQFAAWGGKRNTEDIGPQKRQFAAWGGKRDFAPWGGKRGLGYKYSKKDFNAWGGKRGLDAMKYGGGYE
ncbi:uncharacterized protein LOC111088324 [Limulus polyphemus]|uniref:Uncharacterized protein LOC111088324 n=1 Tax=Limulus polyphemus TaxID=6850 RepID=A0ABM1TD51_LIMPO|nr:uncharacterized protein LOC111088324 [Limulus polyphemus]